MLSVQSCSVNSQNVAFKAKEKKSNVNSTSTSHAGLKPLLFGVQLLHLWGLQIFI